jgi:small GTP-binding protein
VNAEKQTNNNSHLSNKTMSKKNSQNLKKEIVKKKKNKNEINIVFLGDTNTGKSCFVIKFVENIFEKIYIPTLGSEIKKKIVSYNTHKYQLNFIVTSGNDYKDDYTDFYNNADFFLVFYDITIQKSFDNVKEIIQKEILPYLYIYKDGVSNIILIGNKIDIENERKVKIEDVENYCKENKFIFFEISIKTNKNINQMMNTLLKSFDQISYPE